MQHPDLAPFFRAAFGTGAPLRAPGAACHCAAGSYPPCDVERIGEDAFRVTLAVPGFRPEELEVTAERGRLTVRGRRVAAEGPSGGTDAPQFLCRGIARGSFARSFALADRIEVEGARLDHGLLQVSLRRVIPEEERPRRIAVRAE